MEQISETEVTTPTSQILSYNTHASVHYDSPCLTLLLQNMISCITYIGSQQQLQLYGRTGM